MPDPSRSADDDTRASARRDGKPPARYAQVTRAGPLLFVSGQVGRDRTGRLVSDAFDRQADQVFANLEAVLASQGATLDDVVKLTGMLARPDDRPRYAGAMDARFPDGWPAHTLLVISPVDPDERLEIEAVAYLPEGRGSADRR